MRWRYYKKYIICTLGLLLLILFQVLNSISIPYFHTCQYRLDIFSILTINNVIILIGSVAAMLRYSYNFKRDNKWEPIVIFFVAYLVLCPVGQIVLLALSKKHCGLKVSLLILLCIENAVLDVLAIMAAFRIIDFSKRKYFNRHYTIERKRRFKIQFTEIAKSVKTSKDFEDSWNKIIMTFKVLSISTDTYYNRYLDPYFLKVLSWEWTEENFSLTPDCICEICEEKLLPKDQVIVLVANKTPIHSYCISKSRRLNGIWQEYTLYLQRLRNEKLLSNVELFRHHLFHDQDFNTGELFFHDNFFNL